MAAMDIVHNISNTEAYHHLNFTEFNEKDRLEFLFARFRADSYPNVVILTILLGLVFLIGTVGNTLVVVVFARSFVKHNSTYLILTLAVVDLIINLNNIPGILLKEWYYPFGNDVICRIWELIQMATVPISALILVAIAFDRYFLICRAFKGQIPIFWAKLFLVCAVIIGLVLGVPPMLAVGVYQVINTSLPYTEDNLNYIGLCSPNFMLIDSTTLRNYWIFLTVLFVLIIVVLTTLYIFIFLKVYNQSKKWNSLRRKKIIPDQKSANGENQTGTLNRIKSRGLRRFLQFFRRQNTDGNRFDNKNDVFLVTVTAIDNQESSINQKEYTAVELLTPEMNKTRHKCKTPDVPSSAIEMKSLINSDKETKKQKPKKSSSEHHSHQKKAHIKTAYVLCIVTLIYIISYLPTFLITHNVLSGNIFLFYFYFIHSASNPIIYSFMNAQFRNEIKRLFTKKRATI